MLSNTVVLILREVLEAALIICVFLSLNRIHNQTSHWLWLGLLIGFVAGWTYADHISLISSAFEGLGQELLNALLHLIIFISIVVFLVYDSKPNRSSKRHLLASIAILVAVSTVITREAAEVQLYISGFIGLPDMLSTVLFGSAVGLGIGSSVGVFIYYLLVSLPNRNSLFLIQMIMIMLSGSMISQAVQFLVQADIISSSAPLWDSSHIVAERSLIGQLLYALIGYEATPLPIQVVAYLSSICIVMLIIFLKRNSSV